ncbi:MAG: SDR family NAD(P)-dependent oxidoreductase [Acidimicrobiales bacterium]|nr:SDR family NAD(P)-dependent oxidoreductase [Acidimicrobiales bacterium]
MTGASRGIGAAIALELADAGFSVAAVARTAESTERADGSLAETVASIRALGGQAEVVVADLAAPDQRAGLIDRIEASMGPVEALVNNAAVAYYEPVSDLFPKRLNLLLELNVAAPFELLSQAVRLMRERGRGWIVNVSSVTAKVPDTGDGPSSLPLTAYGLTKAALDRLTTGAATELRGEGIVVNSLSPVAGVATPGAVARGVIDPGSPGAEPPDLMARATRLLVTCEPELTGQVLFTAPFLAQRDGSVRGGA